MLAYYFDCCGNQVTIEVKDENDAEYTAKVHGLELWNIKEAN